jgi:hypothetical protein
MAVAAPARRTSSSAAAPARKAATASRPVRARTAPARAPQRTRSKPKRSTGGQLIPVAFGRTATAVRQLPDSGVVVRMTRGRAWIGVLGILLVGIVALNVVTLSLAASTGKVDQSIQALDQENSILRGRDAHKSAVARVRHDAASLGLVVPAAGDVGYLRASPQDVATAAQRLAATE